MASEIGDVAVRVGADITDLKSGMSQASASVGSFGSNAGRHLRQTATNLAKIGAAAAAAGAALTVHLVNNARQAIDAQAKMAQQLNTTSASMATLKRAGDLSGVSLEKITSGTRALTVRLAQAAEGTGPAVDAMKQLGLTAQQLAQMTLDQRIATINARIQETVPAAERAAMSARFFGEEAGTAFALLDSGTMARAAREAELFGLALSDVDAAKVEEANDAMSTIGNAVEGLAQQFTVQLAPILKAVGEQFVKTAEEAGGFGNVALNAMDSVVSGLAFVMDAADGVKRVFQVVADGVIAAWSGMISIITSKFAGVLEMFNTAASAVGVDLFEGPARAVREFSDQSAAVAKEAFANINETLMAPMAGDKFREFVESAKAAGQAAAEAAVQARDAVGGNVVSMDSGRSEKEIEDINKRLEAIRQANMTELELLNEKYAQEVEAIRAGLAEKQIAQDEAYQLSLGAADRYAQAKLKLEQDAAKKEEDIARKKEEAKKAILSQAFGGLTALMNSESRKMFEIGKAAAISQSIVSTYTGMTKALELGWPLGPIAAGAIALNGFAQVANIRKQSFGSGGASSATGSTTGQINAANTPVGGQAVGGGQGGGSVTYVRGIDPGMFYSGGQLIEMINEAQRNGHRLAFEKAAA